MSFSSRVSIFCSLLAVVTCAACATLHDKFPSSSYLPICHHPAAAAAPCYCLFDLLRTCLSSHCSQHLEGQGRVSSRQFPSAAFSVDFKAAQMFCFEYINYGQNRKMGKNRQKSVEKKQNCSIPIWLYEFYINVQVIVLLLCCYLSFWKKNIVL